MAEKKFFKRKKALKLSFNYMDSPERRASGSQRFLFSGGATMRGAPHVGPPSFVMLLHTA